MLPYWTETYGNAGSTSHVFGWDAQDAVDTARQIIASAIGASAREIVFTSGATESNNLALRGVAQSNRRQGGHIVSVLTEHKAVLDPLNRLSRRGFEVTLVPVAPCDREEVGLVDLEQLRDAIRTDTCLVSVMLVNNEIGVIQQIGEIGSVCRSRDILLHTDATQAVGKIPVDVADLGVDLMSFSAHKIYGPKGVGALYVRRRAPRVRLEPQLDGGGQERSLRAGTLNVAGIVGFARALSLCLEEMQVENTRLWQLRQRLFTGLCRAVDDLSLNGPALETPSRRLVGNLNCSFAGIDGEALMMSMRDLAVSSGSACTSTNPEPSHVLRALGISDDLVRSSLRFGLGRFNTADEVDFAIELVSETVKRLRRMNRLS